jgi:Stress responsive A/B Barrel Domain
MEAVIMIVSVWLHRHLRHAAARDDYLDDPNHRPVAEAIGAAAERVVVFDM